ncbi:CU044_5270 family protein [Streptomyces brasiliensis]|uniref:CU044_5270 family protein n=1 Tax=Streptomyces brasiliensis TaxID=1954 RepID=A0A917L2X2_9ACTN|nr:CU044_5270 family protein [Streptomyces brasiliensis]GGJ37214.1 hypothetical protein GCM10010121_055470 [Streptomyces brasiliensis]
MNDATDFPSPQPPAPSAFPGSPLDASSLGFADPAHDIRGWDGLVEAGRVPGPRPEVLAAARATVAEAVRRDIASQSGSDDVVVPITSAPRRRRRGLRVAVTAGVAAAAAVAVVLGTTGTPGPHGSARGGSGTTVTSASAFLRDVADVESARPVSWANAPYWEVRFTRTAADGSRTEAQILSAHRAGLTSHMRVLSPKGGDKSSPGPVGFLIGVHMLSWDEIDRLPTGTAELRRRLGSYADPALDPSEGVFSAVGDLLLSPAPPKLRAALYRVAADLPGVRLVGKVTDSTGRHGTAVERAAGKIVVRYIVDPDDGTLLETVIRAAQAMPAVPEANRPQPESAFGGVPEGRDHRGGRPALHRGQLVERTTYHRVGPTTSPRT